MAIEPHHESWERAGQNAIDQKWPTRGNGWLNLCIYIYTYIYNTYIYLLIYIYIYVCVLVHSSLGGMLTPST